MATFATTARGSRTAATVLRALPSSSSAVASSSRILPTPLRQFSSSPSRRNDEDSFYLRLGPYKLSMPVPRLPEWLTNPLQPQADPAFALAGFGGGSAYDSSMEDAGQSSDDLLNWDGILNAVPKKKTSHSRKRMRSATKYLRDRQDIVRCPACGSPKLSHHLCGSCYSDINRQQKLQWKEGGQEAWLANDLPRLSWKKQVVARPRKDVEIVDLEGVTEGDRQSSDPQVAAAAAEMAARTDTETRSP